MTAEFVLDLDAGMLEYFRGLWPSSGRATP